MSASNSGFNSALNIVVMVGLGVAAGYVFFQPKDYGPPPADTWFRASVLDQRRPVLVKFGATWCGPCRAVDAQLTQVAHCGPARVVKIDVDSRPDLARHYGITAIPRMLLFKDGKVVGDRTGYASADDLRSWIADHSQ
jgi:thioredoxin